ncbi:MAG: cytochrome c [Pseudomonadota bacterium]|nr:cytochrome c [Pseudomonadota bacterium]
MSRAHMQVLPPLAIALAVALAVSACAPSADGDTAADAGRSSSAGLPTGRIDAGATLADTRGQATGQSCIECHGADGNQPLDPSYPKLGGQYRDYLAHALQMYRDGRREHPLMSSQAKDLSDQQIADLAAYFASRPTELRDLQGVH